MSPVAALHPAAVASCLLLLVIFGGEVGGVGREASGGAFLQPCTKFRCEKISTQLLTPKAFKNRIRKLKSTKQVGFNAAAVTKQDDSFAGQLLQTHDSWAGQLQHDSWTGHQDKDRDPNSWTFYLDKNKRTLLNSGNYYRNATAGRRYKARQKVEETKGSAPEAGKRGGDTWRRRRRERRILRRKEKQRVRRFSGSQARTVLQLGARRKPRDGCHKYAIFKVFGTDFVICIILGNFLQDSVLVSSGDLRVSVYGEGREFRSRKLSSMYLQIAEGHVMGQEFSSVRGYVWRDKFYGTVQTDSYILQIEPLVKSNPVVTRYSSVSNRVFNAYVYRVFIKSTKKPAKPMSSSARGWKSGETTQRRYQEKYPGKHKKYMWNTENQIEKVYTGKTPGNKKSHLGSSRFNWSRTKREATSCRSCSLLLIADESFHKEVGEGTVKQTVLQMLHHVREANNLLRTFDFDLDSRPDCLSLHVSGLGVITASSSVDNILQGNFTTPEEYLKAFSRYQFDGYCLAILFSSKVFGNHVLGLSWQGNPDNHSGACQRRTRVESQGKKALYNLNSLFITLRTRVTERIPMRMGVLNLAHEILHSFGSDHDNSSAVCNPQDKRTNGRYLMSRFSGSGVLSNSEKISACTADAVKDGLNDVNQSFCLHPSVPGFCGDGVVSEGEECDCGGVESCLSSRSCCTPPGLRRGEKECRWRKSISLCRNKTELSWTEAISLKRGVAFARKKRKRRRQERAFHMRDKAVQRQVRAYQKQERPGEQLCSILGLKSCRSRSCGGGGCECCRSPSGTCTSPSSLFLNIFRELQLEVSGCAEHVMTCMMHHSSANVLHKLSAREPNGRGKVVCLQSKIDSNCWQIDFTCGADRLHL